MGYGAKKNSTFMESEGLICCWSLKNLEVQTNMLIYLCLYRIAGRHYMVWWIYFYPEIYPPKDYYVHVNDSQWIFVEQTQNCFQKFYTVIRISIIIVIHTYVCTYYTSYV